MPELTLFNSSSLFFPIRNVALIDILIYCKDEDDYDDEEDIIFLKALYRLVNNQT